MFNEIRKLTYTSMMFLSCILVNLNSKPPREIPNELYDRYTLNERIPVMDYYLDGTYSSEDPMIYSRGEINENIIKALRQEQSYYGMTDKWLYEAIEDHPIKGKTVGIIGSNVPWYESIVIAYGGYPYTIEYNKIVTDDPRLNILTFEDYVKNPIQFDVILSISSIEHDGLGRYGDPLNPDGDLDFMELAKEVFLKDDGFMLIAFPVGKDALVWNAHRIYGPIRLPLLLEGWNLRKSYGFLENLFEVALGGCIQPVFYLEKQK